MSPRFVGTNENKMGDKRRLQRGRLPLWDQSFASRNDNPTVDSDPYFLKKNSKDLESDSSS